MEVIGFGHPLIGLGEVEGIMPWLGKGNVEPYFISKRETWPAFEQIHVLQMKG